MCCAPRPTSGQEEPGGGADVGVIAGGSDDALAERRWGAGAVHETV
jgi:hypothetical protein